MLFQYGVCWDDLKMKNSDFDNLFWGHQLERMYNDFKMSKIIDFLINFFHFRKAKKFVSFHQ